MVDDNLVAAIGAKRGLNSGRNRSAGVDIAKYSAIFGVVAIGKEIDLLVGFTKTSFADCCDHESGICKEASKEAGSYQHKEGSNSLVIALLEQARVGGVGDIERHLRRPQRSGGDVLGCGCIRYVVNYVSGLKVEVIPVDG